MVISEEHGYLFIEVPRTGSSAISAELRTNYGGRSILRKHANYWQYLQSPENEGRRLFVFAGVRHPMDDVTSLYLKFVHNHRGDFSNRSRTIAAGGFVTGWHLRRFRYATAARHTFGDYFSHFYRMPYTSNVCFERKNCDHILRFEKLDSDFGEILRRLGLERVRPLPVVNPTAGKTHYIDLFTEDLARRASRVFGPFMADWGYTFPEGWDVCTPGAVANLLYRLTVSARELYFRRVVGSLLHRLVN